MRTLQEKYNAVLEGNFSKEQFKRDAAMELPNMVSKLNSFDDAVSILKNRGVVTEAKAQAPKYSTAKPEDTIAPDVLDTGIKFELDKKHGTLDVSEEEFEKAKEAAIKNLAKDVLHYVKQDSIQLDTPGEKMEKAKLKEEVVEETVDTDALRAQVANILKGQLSSLNKMGGDAIIEDYLETQIDAYLNGDVDVEEPMEVVNDFREYMEHNQSAAADFNAELSPDDTTPETLEEDDLDATEKAASAKIGAGEEFTDDDAAAVADKMPKIKKDAEFKLIGEDEPDAEDLYQHDDEYLATLKQREALKEMFKKIITKVIND